LPTGGWGDVQTITGSGPTTAFWGSSPTDLYVTAAGAVPSVVYHSTGTGSWQAQNTPESSGASDIWGVSSNQIYVAANEAVLFSTGNDNWTAQLAIPAGAVWAAGSDAVYACGLDGFFYRSNGQGDWSEGQEIDPSATLLRCLSMWGTGPDNIYLGTNRGIYRGTLAE
jgi:hypothetical protein